MWMLLPVLQVTPGFLWVTARPDLDCTNPQPAVTDARTPLLLGLPGPGSVHARRRPAVRRRPL